MVTPINFLFSSFILFNSESYILMPPKLSLFIKTLGASHVAYSSNDEIRANADYIQGFSGDVTRILYHEVVHSWQWIGNGQAPLGLIEGIADFVRMKLGNKWDDSYYITAWFLDYYNGLRNGFVAKLTKKMGTEYSDDFFDQL
ncbi:uncharacterized protein LOC131307166 [Rhododendron vialii]|uniref:uncharacterized protein LOC131307166 n=1 Tax=Rhododendron vialii TaxID=182163 RepID=UPI00265FBEF1|nr:uncharacterized protein LOC131307166 [Rhododendron vialii]